MLLLCVFGFVSSSLVALGTLPALLSLMEMAPAGYVDYTGWMMIACLVLLPLYCSFSFARVLIRRSHFTAVLFISVMLALHALGGLLRWEDIGDQLGWYLLSILLHVILLSWLLMTRHARAADQA